MNELELKACLQNAENIIKKGLCMYFREHLNAEGVSVFHFKFNSAELGETKNVEFFVP